MENKLGEISGNKLHQGLEALEASGLSPELWHRMRLDSNFRSRVVLAIRAEDNVPTGEKVTITKKMMDSFPTSAAIVKALQERSPYSSRNSIILKEEIILNLMKEDWEAGPPSFRGFHLDLFLMPIYTRMTPRQLKHEMGRRNIKFATPTEAFIYACMAVAPQNKETVYVLSAQMRSVLGSHILFFGRNGYGNPHMGTTEMLGDDETYSTDTYFLVKQKVS